MTTMFNFFFQLNLKIINNIKFAQIISIKSYIEDLNLEFKFKAVN